MIAIVVAQIGLLDGCGPAAPARFPEIPYWMVEPTRGDAASQDLRVRSFPVDDNCTRQLEGSHGITVVGDFVHDEGCVYDGCFVDDRYYSLRASFRPVLARLGWQAADQRKRGELVIDWLRNSELLGSVADRLLRQDSPVTAPTVTTTSGGGVDVEIWLEQYVTGRRHGEWSGSNELRRWTLRFAADGDLVMARIEQEWSARSRIPVGGW